MTEIKDKVVQGMEYNHAIDIPSCKHLGDRFNRIGAKIIQAGIVQMIDGEFAEFQDIRVYMTRSGDSRD